jgi:hypothetical protein
MGNMNITEINQKKLSQLSDTELKTMFGEYKSLSGSKGKATAKKLAAELNRRKNGSGGLKEKRLLKICSIVLGENFCADFIYEDVDFTKPSEIKEAYEIFEASADWIIYDRKTGKRLSPSKSWRKWQGAKMAAAKIGGDAEVSDKAWYHDNKAKLMGEATDKELDAKDLEKMIKNPDPKRVKSYGGTKYVDMLKSKLAKLKESFDFEKANVLTPDEYDEVSNFKNFNKKDWKWNAIQRKFIRKVKV